LNPALEHTARHNFQNLRDAAQLYDFAIETLKKDLVSTRDNLSQIDLPGLFRTPAPATVLFEILRPAGFHSDQIEQILKAAGHPGKRFFSADHELLIDREVIMVRPRKESTETAFFIQKNQTEIALNDQILRLTPGQKPPANFPKNNQIAWLDEAKIRFPLLVRNWRAGDWFCPLGMGGKRKKIQDFLSDLKVSRFEKERVFVLESEGEICWVIGLRADDRFKVSGETQSALRLEIG
ncbi:MAG: hypothetical protein D6714_07105, partial [Bacteroidetes bacterium]